MLKITAHKELCGRGFAHYKIEAIEGLDDPLTSTANSAANKPPISRDGNMVRVYNDKGDYYVFRVGDWIRAENFPAVMVAVKQACARLAANRKEIAARRAENADWRGSYTLEIDEDGGVMEGQL